MASQIVVRDYDDADWPQVWPIIEEVVRAGDTFPFPTDLTEDEARSIWLENGPGGRATVAVEGDRVLGTAKMGRNRPGPGVHVATASYMVAAEARGRGVGRALVVDSLDWARESGYAAMQFNAVVATNKGAVRPLREPRLHGRRHGAAGPPSCRPASASASASCTSTCEAQGRRGGQTLGERLAQQLDERVELERVAGRRPPRRCRRGPERRAPAWRR